MLINPPDIPKANTKGYIGTEVLPTVNNTSSVELRMISKTIAKSRRFVTCLTSGIFSGIGWKY